MSQPNLRYLMNTPVNELVHAALAREPSLRQTGEAAYQKLFRLATDNGMSIEAVTIGLIIWMSTGTVEGLEQQKV